MTAPNETKGFELSRGFAEGAREGGLDLGAIDARYRELFAHALEDGVITAEERERLNLAADDMGMSRAQLERLERAMVNAYEAHHRVKVAVPMPGGGPETAPLADGDRHPDLTAEIARLKRRIEVLEEELREARSHMSVEVDLSGLAAAKAVTEETPEELSARIRRDPANPQLFARLYRACGNTGQRDLQYRAAQALVVLGAADGAQTQLVAENRPEAGIAPTRALSSADWHGGLTHSEFEVVTGQILSAITPAALMGRVAVLRRNGELSEPSESQKQDPTKSTVMAVRALAWAARVVGMPTPSIYTDVESDVGFAHSLGVPPYSVVGKAVLAGRTQTENAFLAARHMAYYRAEFFVRVLCPAITDLEDMFLAALLIASPSLPVADHVRARVQPISTALAPMLDGERRDTLRAHFKAFVADGGRTNLLRWSDSIDKTACRAGLLSCGDLGAATRLLASEEGPEGSLRADLLAFTVSDRYTELRQRLGIALTPS